MDRALLEEEFARNFSERGDLGASVSVWQSGREVVTLARGYQDRERTLPWQVETPVLFWSATKGLAAASFLHACERHQVELTRRASEFWPEFSAAGKAEITLEHVLTHRAGLSALKEEVPVLDYPAVIAALAAQEPGWRVGEGHGYHPRTFGFLLDELLRRITGGTTLREYWRQTFAEPLALRIGIGLPPERAAEVAPVFASRSAPPKGDPFYSAVMTSGSLTARTFASPKGLHSTSAMNSAEARTASFPAFGGIGDAWSLGKFYAMLAHGGEMEGQRFFSKKTLALMSRTLVSGPDKVLLTPTAFSAGFMQDPVAGDGRKIRDAFGPSPFAFGHPGAGGSHAFADPEHDCSFAYVMNQMEPGVLPGERSTKLVQSLYQDSGADKERLLHQEHL